MNPNSVGLAKIAAVVFSSTLAAVFVYDQTTGGAFSRRLTAPDAVAPAVQPVSDSQPVAGTEAASEAPTILFSGSKSYSGRTTVVPDGLSSGAESPQHAPHVISASPNLARPTTLMSGSKTLLIAPVQAAVPTPAANYPPTAGPYLPTQAESINAPSQPAYVARPPSASASPAAPSRPTRIMMGTKSAPVFMPPMQQSAPYAGPALPPASQPQMQTARPPAANGPGRQSGAAPSQQPNPGNAGAIRDF